MAAARHTLQRAVATTALTAVALGIGGGCTGDGTDTARGEDASLTADATLSGLTIDVRKEPGCGCCTSWVEYLEEHGATVAVTEDADRDSFRAEHGIPDDAASCHTAIVDGYAIEGHVPVGAIEQLLAGRPNAAGLALPGMPADGPGMGGDQNTWERQPVMLVGTDGVLTAFEY